MLHLALDASAAGRAGRGLRAAAREVTHVVARQAVGQPAGELLVSRIRAEAPVGKDRTDRSGAVTHQGGTLRRSVALRRAGTGYQIVAADYAGYVVHGTRPHEIVPRTKRVLAFTAGGEAVVTRRVNHPGTKPNDFPRRALDSATPGLRLLLRSEGERLIRLVKETA